MKLNNIFIIVALILAISMSQSEAGLANTTVTEIVGIQQFKSNQNNLLINGLFL